MLTYLHVKNIALIDELEVEFDDGFNIMTGETGAGKSIIIGSINAVLGNKIAKDFVRSDAEYALIELIFSDISSEVKENLHYFDIEIDDEILISRKISQNGRSLYKINGQAIGATELKEITSLLIDIHSQREHQSLLEKNNHIKLLDRYLGNKVTPLLNNLKDKYKQYIELKTNISSYGIDEEERKREISFLEYEVLEIESTNLRIGEDEELESIFKKQSNMKNIQNSLSSVLELINGQEHMMGASFQISKALEDLYHIKSMDNDILRLYEQLEQIDILTSDFVLDLSRYAGDLYIDEQALEETRARIDIINKLKMKHGNQIEDILDVLKVKREKLDELINFEDRFKKINKKIEALEIEIKDICKQLSIIRKEGALSLANVVLTSLKDLNLQNTDFLVKITEKPGFNGDGLDDVEFLISTNLGEKAKPLIQIASGGELSRVMLSIKSVLADCDDISTLIFDEIDTGISGRTAQLVAEKMAALSRQRQIICITHLPQIASMADNHYLITKNSKDNRTITTMNKLSNEEVPNELARLLGGVKITDAVRTSALEMKLLANEIKMKNK